MGDDQLHVQTSAGTKLKWLRSAVSLGPCDSCKSSQDLAAPDSPASNASDQDDSDELDDADEADGSDGSVSLQEQRAPDQEDGIGPSDEGLLQDHVTETPTRMDTLSPGETPDSSTPEETNPDPSSAAPAVSTVETVRLLQALRATQLSHL